MPGETKADLQKDRDLAWQAYTTLLAKAQEIDIAAAFEDIEVRFVSPTLPPNSPVASNTLQNTLLALVVGLTLGVGSALFFNGDGKQLPSATTTRSDEWLNGPTMPWPS